uniref:peptidylprolyl isomerase n=1 Tax=Trieres chinensis TaxID=1514140 RepID=A0A7S2EUH9_TRICV
MAPTTKTAAAAMAATAALCLLAAASAFAPPLPSRTTQTPPRSSALFAVRPDAVSDADADAASSRRSFLGAAAAIALAFPPADPALALVKGNAPPPPKAKSDRKCSNVEECQEQAERLAKQQEEEARANAVPLSVTPSGTRYKEMEPSPLGDSAPLASKGDTVDVYYKVLKLGKRSYDGISGEATVVFSRGYGLEDDENKPEDRAFTFTVGDPTVIDALNDALIGMPLGSTRRVAVLPQVGWRKPGRECDGGPGGSGAGGELKTDYVVVPTATMVAEEACFDKDRRPFPTDYAKQRRMAQRFDQSLIVEVKLGGINGGK